jgi:hypothetical protein
LSASWSATSLDESLWLPTSRPECVPSVLRSVLKQTTVTHWLQNKGWANCAESPKLCRESKESRTPYCIISPNEGSFFNVVVFKTTGWQKVSKASVNKYSH